MDLEQIKLSTAEKEAIKKKTPQNMPLNPTAKGYSGQEVRKYFTQALVDENGSILASMEEKLSIIKDFLKLVFGDKVIGIQTQIDTLFSQVSSGFLVFEDLETANGADVQDGTYAFIKIPVNE